jgi:ParB/RepB/Spo0J family partition protein
MGHNATTPTLGEILMVKTSELVVANEFGVNRMNATELQPLVSSIVRCGLLHPPGVYLESSRFHLAYGHRRYAAAVQCGLDVIPCLLINKEDALSAFIAENIQRKNLNFFDLTCVRKKDMECRGMSWNDYAEQVLQIPKTTYFEQLSIFKLPSEILDRHRNDRVLGLRALKRVLKAGSLAEMHAAYDRELAAATNPKPRKPRSKGNAIGSGGNTNSVSTNLLQKAPPAQHTYVATIQPRLSRSGSNMAPVEGALEVAIFIPIPANGGSTQAAKAGSTVKVDHAHPQNILDRVMKEMELAQASDPVRFLTLRALMMMTMEGCGNPESVRLLLDTKKESIHSTKSIQHNLFSSNNGFSVLDILLRFRACLARLIQSVKGGICKLFSSIC